jgi:hypothetical protein
LFFFVFLLTKKKKKRKQTVSTVLFFFPSSLSPSLLLFEKKKVLSHHHHRHDASSDQNRPTPRETTTTTTTPGEQTEEERAGGLRVRRRVRGVRRRRCVPKLVFFLYPRRELDLINRPKKQKDGNDERVVFENFFPGVALLFSRALFRRASDRRTSLSLSLSTHIFTRTAEWTRENEEKEDVAQWEDDWDDTEADDFKTHLREELKKNVASRQRQQK